MKVRCKLQLTESTQFFWGGAGRRLVFSTIYDQNIPEDERFCKATPSGRFEMQVDNLTALEFFKMGKYYYFDAVEIEQ